MPGSGRRPEECYPALIRLVRERPDAVLGCDFPFALPRELMAEETWDAFARGFDARFQTAEDFRAYCRERSGGRELRRQTDRAARAPFAAYNARIYRQTFHGIRDFLAPLARAGAAAIRPMQPWRPGVALVFEICPASILKREGLYRPYKGTGAALAGARERILMSFENRGVIAIDSDELRRRILDDPGGDALDSVIAALGARWARDHGADHTDPPELVHAIEGWIYVACGGAD